jgi:outer membrane lipoprotein-sorting protein
MVENKTLKINNWSIFLFAMVLKKHLLSSCFCLLMFSVFAQKSDIILDDMSNELDSLSKTNESESIYIKTNKGIYETKEDLWFKGYILNNRSLKPSFKSKIFFMQLISEVDSTAIWQEKYPIKNGFVYGHVYLHDSLTSGSYYLEGYTANSVFQNQKEIKSIRKIRIIKKIDSLKDKVIFKEIAKDHQVEFTMFPEGGKLVSGIESVLAFKANNTKGLPVKIRGFLYENNKKILNFKTVHNGLGMLTFTPDITKSYFIKLNDRFSKTKYALPKIHKKGKTLRLFPNSKTNLLFKVNQPKTEISETVYLRVQMNGKVYFVAKALIKDKVFF